MHCSWGESKRIELRYWIENGQSYTVKGERLRIRYLIENRQSYAVGGGARESEKNTITNWSENEQSCIVDGDRRTSYWIKVNNPLQLEEREY